MELIVRNLGLKIKKNRYKKDWKCRVKNGLEIEKRNGGSVCEFLIW